MGYTNFIFYQEPIVILLDFHFNSLILLSGKPGKGSNTLSGLEKQNYNLHLRQTSRSFSLILEPVGESGYTFLSAEHAELF